MEHQITNSHTGQLGKTIFHLLISILMLGLAFSLSPGTFATDDIVLNLDAQGPDDVPNQSDISQSGFSDNHLVAPFDPYDSPYYDVSWTFDDTDRTGANSADACAFFDSDDTGGFADFAMCASFQENAAKTGLELTEVKLFDCKNSEPKPDEGARCPFTGGGGDGSSGLIASGSAPFADPNIGTLNNSPGFDSQCILTVNVPDPFAGVSGREGEQNPNEDDQVECIVFVDEMVELDTDVPSGIVLSNVCSFTSLDPNSERKDCIDIPSTITIVKNLVNGMDDTFAFNLGINPLTTILTSGGTGTSDPFTLDAGDYNLTEDLTGNDEWELLSAECVNDDGVITDILASGGALTLASKESEICTFTNSLVPNPIIKIMKSGVKSDDVDGDDAGDEFAYTFIVTNIGNVPLNPVTVADPLINNQPDVIYNDITCVTDPATDPVALNPNPNNPNTPPYLDGDSAECSATYILSQTDIDNNGNGIGPNEGDGKIYNTATASGTDPDNTVVTDMDDEMLMIAQEPEMSVVKSSATTSLNASTTVTYNYTVSNDGNVTLTGVGISDDNDNDDASCASTTIAVGGSTTCTATHTFTQAELDANGSPIADSGELFNNVTASSNEAPDAFDDLGIPIISIFLTKDLKNFTNVDGSVDTNNDPTITFGDILFYKFTVTNTGSLDLTPTGSVFVEDLTFALTVTCDAAILAPGASTDCETTNGHVVTLAEANAGQVSNTAIARGKDEFGLVVTHTTPVVITPVDANPSIEIVKSTNGVSASDPTAGDAPIIPIGGIVNWSYKVTNTGNVTISNIDVMDDQGVAVSCPETTLAPEGMMTCTASGFAENLLNTTFTTVPGLCGVFTMTPLYENKGTATGTVTNGTLEPDSDFSHYCNPQIAELTLAKTVTKDNGGTAADTAFTLSAAGPTNISGVEGDTDITDRTVVIGNYALSETALAGYTYESLSCVNTTAGGTDVSGVSKANPNLTLYTTDDVTCTFVNNDDAPKLTLIKVVDNGANQVGMTDATDWTLTATGPTGFSGQTGVMSDADFDQGTYDLSESATDSALYVASDWVCVGGTQDNADTISLALGDEATCTITNTSKGRTKVIKTFNGLPITGPESFTFELREGAAPFATGSAGTLLEGPLTANALNGGVIEFTYNLIPGNTYQLCETNQPNGWSNNMVDSFTPLGGVGTDVDNSNECVNFVAESGVVYELAVDNIPPPGGDARTIGFWKNWTACDGHGNQEDKLGPKLPITLGVDPLVDPNLSTDPFVISTCPVAVDLLDKRKVGDPLIVGDGKKSAGDPIYNMVAQLVAAKVNIKAPDAAGSCTALTDAIASADALLDEVGFDGNMTYRPKGKNKGALADAIAEANYLGGILDAYNNNELCP